MERFARSVRVSIRISSERTMVPVGQLRHALNLDVLGQCGIRGQINLLAETSSQDKEALLCLASAINDDSHTLDGRFIGSVRAILAVQLSPLLGGSLLLSPMPA